MTINFNGIEMNISSAELNTMLNEAREADRRAIQNNLSKNPQRTSEIAKKANISTAQAAGYLVHMGVIQDKQSTVHRWAELDDNGNLTGNIKTEVIKHTVWHL